MSSSIVSGDSPQSPATPRQPVPDEPVLRIDNIQGNILTGFNKPLEWLVFLSIDDATAFRSWLREDLCFIASAAETFAFNDLYKTMKQRRGRGRHLKSLWWSIAFSFPGLQALAPKSSDELTDQAFREGLHRRSASLGDPTTGDGSPETWMIGGPDKEAHVLVILAADDDASLTSELEYLENGLQGATILYKEKGATIPGPTGFREHFGFRDGISQPGIRGRISQSPTGFLTPRQNPLNPDQGTPGQDLVWPGEFVLGYPGQEAQPQPPPSWAIDGSFLVMRRLRQKVPEFLSSMVSGSQILGIDRSLFEAQVVGRFKSGVPLMQSQVDSENLAKDDCRNNYFVFSSGSAALLSSSGTVHPNNPCQPGPLPPPDDLGHVCPFAAHIRKVNPRNDQNRFGTVLNPSDTLTHRILRRGIPYGPPYSDKEPDSAGKDRGLLFLAYQASIEKQFEHIQIRWANNAEDAIGQDPMTASASRFFTLPVKANNYDIVRFDFSPWIIPTGGGYFFVPSISTLASLATGRLP